MVVLSYRWRLYFSFTKVTHNFAFASLHLLSFGLGMLPSQGFSLMYTNRGEWPHSARIRTFAQHHMSSGAAQCTSAPPPSIHTPSGAAQRASAPPPSITHLVELLSAHPHPHPASHGTAVSRSPSPSSLCSFDVGSHAVWTDRELICSLGQP